MKITARDIADKAGISTAAVSLALNNKSGVSEDTRGRVIQIAMDMGYDISSRVINSEPNTTVRFLKIPRHGHTVNKNHNYFIDAYVEGISATATENGAVLEVEAYGHDEPLDNILSRIKDSAHITGYLILGTELSETDIRSFLATGKNIVFVDTFLDYISADFVDMNNTDAVYKLINHFIEMGHKEIGLIKSSVNTRNFHLRVNAFNRVMENLGLPVNEKFIVDVDSTFENAHADFDQYLRTKPQLPSVFFAINDIIAMGCMGALQEAGIFIPDDVSIAAFDNLPMAKMVSPSLTSIEVSKQEIGQTAFDMLLQKVNRGEVLPPRKTLIGGKLIKRDSVKNLN